MAFAIRRSTKPCIQLTPQITCAHLWRVRWIGLVMHNFNCGEFAIIKITMLACPSKAGAGGKEQMWSPGSTPGLAGAREATSKQGSIPCRQRLFCSMTPCSAAPYRATRLIITQMPDAVRRRLELLVMRWNHIIWGRNEPPEPNVTTEAQRATIAECRLTRTHGRKTWLDVHLGGLFIGRVRTTWGGQEFVLPGESMQQRRYAGFVWGENDPKHALALLRLLGA